MNHSAKFSLFGWTMAFILMWIVIATVYGVYADSELTQPVVSYHWLQGRQ